MSDLAKAVSFAAKMMRDGEYLGKAISVAANYYGVDRAEVRSGLSSRSGKSQRGKPKPRYQWTGEERCHDCGEPAIYRGTVRHCYSTIDYVFSCASCGKRLPCWWEGIPDSVRWTTKPEAAP